MDENDTLSAKTAGASIAIQAILGGILSRIPPDQAISLLKEAHEAVTVEINVKLEKATIGNKDNTVTWCKESKIMAEAVIDSIADYAKVEL
ncbi:hypothetical protein [Agrobacterium vitis]|uniref:hypothetical protein n=1 Tax=Agrobacterium vitis TaxID=373 RepID=UPI0012E7A949|nr:hypothetical protein [Agrobacterium vitis]MUZ65312.1 hypothetical protein [Agrobacterium vitis]